MDNQRAALPEWSGRIRQLIEDLKITQADLAGRLGVSPATVTRWLKGTNEPRSGAYVAMGNMAAAPDGVYFWERAGLDPARFPGMSIHVPVSSMKVDLKDFTIVAAMKVSQKVVAERSSAVVIPMLNLIAFGDRIPPNEHITISQATVEDVIMAPLTWCPHPESMICMKVEGESMMPVIPPGSIIAVDTAVTDRGALNRKLTLFSHRDLGYKVSRLQRLPTGDILISANHTCLPVDVSDSSKWKALGEVLWWVSKDAPPNSPAR